MDDNPPRKKILEKDACCLVAHFGQKLSVRSVGQVRDRKRVDSSLYQHDGIDSKFTVDFQLFPSIE